MQKFSKNDINTKTLENIIEYYGFKNIRIFMSAAPINHTFFAMTGIPIGLSCSSDEQVPMVEFHIADNDYRHKIKLSPSEKYCFDISQYGKVVGQANVFGNERFYFSDFMHHIKAGMASVYLETEDGYQHLIGVYEDILCETDNKAIAWAENFMNSHNIFNNTAST